MTTLRIIKGQRGNSLIMAMIGVAITGITAAAIASLIGNLNNHVAVLTQKIEARDLQVFISQAFSEYETCNEILKDKAINLTGVSTTKTGNNPLALQEIKIGGASGLSIVKTGEKISTQSNLVAEKIEFTDFLATGAPDLYIGKLRVTFDRKSEKAPLKPIEVNRLVRTIAGDPVGAKRIESCVGGTGAPNANNGGPNENDGGEGQEEPEGPNTGANGCSYFAHSVSLNPARSAGNCTAKYTPFGSKGTATCGCASGLQISNCLGLIASFSVSGGYVEGGTGSSIPASGGGSASFVQPVVENGKCVFNTKKERQISVSYTCCPQ